MRAIKTGLRGKASGIIIGKRLPGLVAYSPTRAEQHAIIMGGSGLGKTSAIIIPTLRSWNGTFFAIDVAGDIEKNVPADNKMVFEPEDAHTAPYSVFDTVDLCNTPAGRYELLEQLALLLMPDIPNETGAGAFFTAEGRKILTAALICFYSQGLDFVPICKKIVQSGWRDLLNEIVSFEDSCPKALEFIASFSGASEQNTAGCKQSVDMAVKLFATNETLACGIRRPRTGEAYFAPRMLEQNNVFVKISDAKLELFGPLLKIITAQTLEYCSARPAENTGKILLCLDELPALGKLHLLHALRTLRKRHIRIMACVQSMADLDLTYGIAERRAMLNNFALQVVLGASDFDTQDYFSKTIGEQRVKPTIGDSIAGRRVLPNQMERIVPPAKLARLRKRLILLSPDGYVKLWKNYYYKRF